jgi:hypothetical protein
MISRASTKKQAVPVHLFLISVHLSTAASAIGTFEKCKRKQTLHVAGPNQTRVRSFIPPMSRAVRLVGFHIVGVRALTGSMFVTEPLW